MKVVWKPGYTPRNVSAEVAYEVVNNLNMQGKKEAGDLVDASRPVDAPLHPLFEWDDSIAAEKYREKQARDIITHIFLVPEKEEEEAHPPVRAFFQIDNHSSDYEPIHIIMRDEDKKTRLLEIAKKELISFKVKYQTLTELAGVMTAIDEVLDE